MKVQMDIRDAPPGVTAWQVAAAILEAVEVGSSRHCLYHTEELGHHEYRHARLGLTIDIHAREGE